MACQQRGPNIAVGGVPKTIDNDIDLIDRSFGFQSAVAEAQAALNSAETEARCNKPNGIGVVKLMGRHSGYIAAYATMAHGSVDLCLIPEVGPHSNCTRIIFIPYHIPLTGRCHQVPLVLDGENGCLPHLERVVANKGHAVVVVAEGTGEKELGESAEV